MRSRATLDLQRATLIPTSVAFYSRQHPNVRQIAVLLRIIEPVAHNKFIRDCEADVIRIDGQLAARGLVQKDGDTEPFWLMSKQQPLEKAQCEAGIKNVLHQNHI